MTHTPSHPIFAVDVGTAVFEKLSMLTSYAQHAILFCSLCVGRLDEIIYVPLPDEKSRQTILRMMLRQYSVAVNVDLTFLARILIGVSGAGIVDFCRQACAEAIRESTENKQKPEYLNLDSDSHADNSGYEIQRNHFETAMKFLPHLTASEHDLQKYEAFTQMWQFPFRWNSPFHILTHSQNYNENGKKFRLNNFPCYIVVTLIR